jgi:hypothetical protein
MTSKVIVAALVGGIIAFIGGFLIYGLALQSFMAANAGTATGVMKTDMSASNMIYIFIGNLASGLLLAYIFDKWANIRTLSMGAQAGALIGLLIAASVDFTMYGTSNIMNMTAVFVDIIAGTVLSALVGAGVAWWLGRK